MVFGRAEPAASGSAHATTTAHCSAALKTSRNTEDAPCHSLDLSPTTSSSAHPRGTVHPPPSKNPYRSHQAGGTIAPQHDSAQNERVASLSVVDVNRWVKVARRVFVSCGHRSHAAPQSSTTFARPQYFSFSRPNSGRGREIKNEAIVYINLTWESMRARRYVKDRQPKKKRYWMAITASRSDPSRTVLSKPWLGPS